MRSSTSHASGPCCSAASSCSSTNLFSSNSSMSTPRNREDRVFFAMRRSSSFSQSCESGNVRYRDRIRGCECVSAESRRHGAPLLRSSVSRKVRLLPLPQRQHLLHTFLQSAQKSRLERKRNYTPWLRCHTVFPYPVMQRWNSAAYILRYA